MTTLGAALGNMLGEVDGNADIESVKNDTVNTVIFADQKQGDNQRHHFRVVEVRTIEGSYGVAHAMENTQDTVKQESKDSHARSWCSCFGRAKKK